MLIPFKKNSKIYYLLLPGLVVAVCLFFSQTAQAALIFFTASASKVAVGKTFTITASINTQSKTINNAEAKILYPADLVEAVSVSNGGSIFTIWVEQPILAGNSGSISFNGGLPNPGYNGGNGKVLSAVFKAKKAGTATFSFSQAAIRENDGMGTNIFAGQNSVKVEISSTAEPETSAAPEAGTLQVAAISSPTHPDQNAWYSAKAAQVKWKLPAAASAIQTLINLSAGSEPYVLYRPPVFQKEVNNLSDGVWYFHLRYQTALGWSKTSHYRLQVDSIPPVNLSVTPTEEGGKYRLSVKAEDALSGIDYYNIIINNQPPLKVTAQAAADPIDLPLINLGGNNIVVSVFDKAGNKIETVVSLIAAAKVAPLITKYSENLNLGEALNVVGSSIYTQATVVVVIKDPAGQETSQETITDNTGGFNFNSQILNKAGDYQFWAYIKGLTGNGPSTEKNNFKVNERVAIAVAPVTHISFFDILIVIIVILILIILYICYRLLTLRKRLKLSEKRANRAFKLLFEKANNQIDVLEKTKKDQVLTGQQKKALNELREILAQIEEMSDSKNK